MKHTKDRQPPLRIQVEKGYKAFHRGRVTNPYKIDTAFYKEWERGFNKAYFENLEKIKNRIGAMAVSISTVSRNHAA